MYGQVRCTKQWQPSEGGQWQGRSVINAVMTVHTTCVITDQCPTFLLYHSTPSLSLSLLHHSWLTGQVYVCTFVCLMLGHWLKILHSFFWFTKILILFHEYIHFVCCLMFWWSEERGFLTYMWFLDVLV